MLNNLRPTAERPLGPLEQRLLHVLWTRGTATVRELLDGLEHKIAYTTAMTTLDRLYKKRLLNRVVEGRAFRYSPRLTQIELKKAAADKAIQRTTGLKRSTFVATVVPGRSAHGAGLAVARRSAATGSAQAPGTAEKGETVMFAARGIALSLSVFILLYGSLSLLVCGGWRLFASVGPFGIPPGATPICYLACVFFPFWRLL